MIEVAEQIPGGFRIGSDGYRLSQRFQGLQVAASFGQRSSQSHQRIGRVWFEGDALARSLFAGRQIFSGVLRNIRALHHIECGEERIRFGEIRILRDSIFRQLLTLAQAFYLRMHEIVVAEEARLKVQVVRLRGRCHRSFERLLLVAGGVYYAMVSRPAAVTATAPPTAASTPTNTAAARQAAPAIQATTPVQLPPEAAPPSAEAEEAALHLGTAERQRLQMALTALGFDTRGSDGAFGPRSREMITAWQQARNRPATGYLTAAEWDTMGRTAFRAGSKPASADRAQRRSLAKVPSRRRKL